MLSAQKSVVRLVGFQQGYAAAQTFTRWVLPPSLVSPVTDASHLIDLCIWDSKAFVLLYRLLWFKYKLLSAKQARKCSCCAQCGWLCPSLSTGVPLHVCSEGKDRHRNVTEQTVPWGAVDSGLAAECCWVRTVPLLRRHHDGQGFCFLPEMQRWGFPKCKRVEKGHSSTDYLYDMCSYHTDACAHIHTNKEKHTVLLCGTQKYELDW